MAIVLDTSVLIDHLRGDQGARGAMLSAATSGERLATSILTKVEIMAGMRPKEEQATRSLLDSLELIEVDDAIAAAQSGLGRNLFRNGWPDKTLKKRPVI